MDADWAVELGADDETLEHPWSAQGPLRYYDLKRHPELVDSIEEARRYPELRAFLTALNARESQFETAKCDVWFESEVSAQEQEEVYGGSCRFGCYVDLLFTNVAYRFSFERHESVVKCAARIMGIEEAGRTAVQLIVRRCFFHAGMGTESEDGESSALGGICTKPGFYVTLYAFGYGDDQRQAQSAWAAALEIAATGCREAIALLDRDRP